MAGIYRKKAIDRLSSPEQLDRMIPIVQPATWLALIGAAIVVAAVLIWAVFGTLKETTALQGIVIQSDETYCAIAEGDSMIVCYLTLHEREELDVGTEVSFTVGGNSVSAWIVQMDDYVTSYDAALQTLGDEALVSALCAGQPVVATRCCYEGDALRPGTLAFGEAVVRTVRPISYVLPIA